jgi:predicted regulator of Ras-like GTPase activity (Roadblock/LC7/MglB family)
MRKVLKRLNEHPGIRGSLVVTHDGMVVAASLEQRMSEEKVAAMASTVVSSVHRALEENGLSRFHRLTLKASYGKLTIRDTGTVYLVVVMDRSFDPGPTEIEIESARMRIKALGEMKVAR